MELKNKENIEMKLKKNFRYNDSRNKYKKNNPKLIKNRISETNQNNEDIRLHNKIPRIKIYSNNFQEKDSSLNYNSKTNLERNGQIKSINTSTPKNGYLRKSFPNKCNNLKNYKILQTEVKTENNSSPFRANKQLNNISQIFNHRKYIDSLPSFVNRIRGHSSRTNHKNILSRRIYNLNTESSGYISDISYRTVNKKSDFIDYSKHKELLRLNVILQRQNKELRQKYRLMKLKIYDLIKQQEVIEMDNQNLYNDKNRLLIKVQNLEEELDNIKNLSLNELETRSNTIRELNDEIIRMKNILEEKENNIINLTNNNSFYNSKINYIDNNNYNKKNFPIDIKELNFNDEENNSGNINSNNNNNNELIEIKKTNNDLINQINNLKLKNKNILIQKQKNERILNQKVNNLIQQNKKNNSIILNLKTELQKSNNNISNQFQNKMGELQDNYILLQKKYHELKETKDRMDSNLELILEEKNNLIKENTELKNKQNSMSLKLSTSYNNYMEENNNLKYQLNEKEKEIEEYKIQLNDLYQKNNEYYRENINLQKKKIELENVNSSLKEINNKIIMERNENNLRGFGEKEVGFEDGTFSLKINKENVEKNDKVQKYDKEIMNIKIENEKLSKENIKLKETINLMQRGQEEGLLNTLENLKEEIKDKKKQIEKLIKENINMRNTMKNNNVNYISNFNSYNEGEEEREFDLNNDRNENNPFRVTINSQGLTDADKIKLYKERIKEFQVMNESDKVQIKILKEDIKSMKARIRHLETFGGKVNNIDEFRYLLNQILIICRPQNNEQKEALAKIVEIINNLQR